MASFGILTSVRVSFLLKLKSNVLLIVVNISTKKINLLVICLSLMLLKQFIMFSVHLYKPLNNMKVLKKNVLISKFF